MSVDIKDEIITLIRKSGQSGIARDEIYKAFPIHTNIEIARLMHELVGEEWAIRVGDGKAARYVDPKSLDSTAIRNTQRFNIPTKPVCDPVPLAPAAPMPTMAAEDRAQALGFSEKEMAWTGRPHKIRRGTPKSQVLYAMMQYGRVEVSLDLIYNRVLSEAQAVGGACFVLRSKLAIICSSLAREGYIVSRDRGCYAYNGPKYPFVDSNCAIFPRGKSVSPDEDKVPAAPKETVKTRDNEDEAAAQSLLVNLENLCEAAAKDTASEKATRLEIARLKAHELLDVIFDCFSSKPI
jgi:hypothetical protein